MDAGPAASAAVAVTARDGVRYSRATLSMAQDDAQAADVPLPDVGGRRLLAYSQDRTIWLQVAHDGVGVVRKVFETGHAAAAEDESRLGTLLAGPGFVTYLGAERDPESGKPSTLTLPAPGRDLWRMIATDGPMPPRQVALLGLALHGVLRRLHSIAIHRDIKPANVMVGQTDDGALTVALLDAEHAWLLQDTLPRAAFSGGSHGWSPPEAYANAVPRPAFDVFGLGATLWYAATGNPPLSPDEGSWQRWPRTAQLVGLPAALIALLTGCLAADPKQRPALDDLEDQLASVLAEPRTPTTDVLDRALAALQRGDTSDAQQALDSAAARVATATVGDIARREDLERRLRRTQRLLERRPLPALPAPGATPATCVELARRLRRLTAFAARFPAHTGLQHEMRQLRRQLAHALDGLAELVASHKRAARFAAARAELDAARAAVVAAAPAGGPLPDLPRDRAPTALQRAPMRLVALALDDLERAQSLHEAMLAELEQAEAQLDVGAAAQAIDHAIAIYSGASEVAANLKDRLHRLTYFVERLAQPSEVLTPLTSEAASTGLAVDLGIVEQCLDRCRQQCRGRRPKTPLGLRALQRTLRDLIEELPATKASVGAAETALSATLEAVSEHAWTVADDCRSKLQAVPIPIRPLQNLIARLDHLRVIDAMVDCRRGTRAELLDEVERMRSDLDQARTTRDRIASGAREAMERGHLTTALYDMARAVDRYDAPASELEEARKRKHEVEEAVRENHRLAARYVELEDDPNSAVDERVEVLEQRRRVLESLGARVAAERAVTYAQDRLDVEVRILQERAADAERRIDTLTDPGARLNLATTTLEELDRFGSERGADLERLGRVQRLREHWDSLRQRALADMQRADSALRETRRRRLRSRLVRGLVAALTAALAVTSYFLLRRAAVPDAVNTAASSVRSQLVAPSRMEEFDPVQAVIQLDRFVGDLERSGLPRSGVAGAAEVVRAARALVDAVSSTARDSIDPASWVATLRRLRAEFAAAQRSFAPGASEAALDLAAALPRFDAASEIAAVILAVRGCTNAEGRQVLRDYAAERGLELRF